MKRIALLFAIVLAVTIGCYYFNVYSYVHWFNTHLMATVWTSAKERELEEILSQSFRYCAQGSTSKAYASEDNRFVIKTFIKKKCISKKFGMIPFVCDFANKRRALKVKYDRSFGSIYAYQFIPKESGMIYYQFVHPTDFFHKSIHLIEKDGSISELDLDKDEYVIQKKAIIVSDYIKVLLKKGEFEKVKVGIGKLIHLTKALTDQGIVLAGLQFLENFGFVDDEPIRIDVEHVHFDPDWKEKGKSHLRREISNFRGWLVARAPEQIVEYFDSQTTSILD